MELRNVRTVFLDRDGTINVKAAEGEYIRSPVELVLVPGAAEAVAALNAAGLRTVLVTNQRWLSEPSADPTHFAAIQDRLRQLLADQGARLDAAYHCPNAAKSCDCRKPLAGMLIRAAAEHSFDVAESVMIGDSDADVMAGRAAGAATILLRAGGGRIPARTLRSKTLPRPCGSSSPETLRDRPGHQRERKGRSSRRYRRARRRGSSISRCTHSKLAGQSFEIHHTDSTSRLPIDSSNPTPVPTSPV
jgi:D-glycero-D-manno-heptose 1,7-bisphosphate phosphatase